MEKARLLYKQTGFIVKLKISYSAAGSEVEAVEAVEASLPVEDVLPSLEQAEKASRESAKAITIANFFIIITLQFFLH